MIRCGRRAVPMEMVAGHTAAVRTAAVESSGVGCAAAAAVGEQLQLTKEADGPVREVVAGAQRAALRDGEPIAREKRQ